MSLIRERPPTPQRQREAGASTPPVLIYLPPAAAAVLDLGARSCRWPIGRPDQDGFHFCRAPVGHRGSYCSDHLARSRAGGAR